MAKTTQKNKPQTKLSKQKILLIIAGLLILALAVFISVKIYEKNKALEEKKNLLDRSLVAVRNVSDKFYDQIQESTKQKDFPARGRCSSAGKYSTLYTCGPEARVTVAGLDEAQYRKLNDLAIVMYSDSQYFQRVGSTEPHETALDPGLSGTAGAELKGSDVGCHYLSNYVPEEKTASFSWGCKLMIYDQYYPTSY